MYRQRLYGHVSLISHPYGDSSAPPYLGTAILTILCFLKTEEQEPERTILQLQDPPGDTDRYQLGSLFHPYYMYFAEGAVLLNFGPNL